MVFFYTPGNVKSSKLMVDVIVTVHYNNFILLSCTLMSVVSKIFFLHCLLHYLHMSLKVFS